MKKLHTLIKSLSLFFFYFLSFFYKTSEFYFSLQANS